MVTRNLVDLMREVAEMDPITSSYEGLDDGCFFCGNGRAFYGETYASCYHDDNCLWVQARAIFGLSSPLAGEEPGPVYGPPTPDRLLSLLEQMMGQYRRAMVKELNRPLWGSSAIQSA